MNAYMVNKDSTGQRIVVAETVERACALWNKKQMSHEIRTIELIGMVTLSEEREALKAYENSVRQAMAMEKA